MEKKYLFFSLIFTWFATSCQEECYWNNYSNFTDYSIEVDSYTPSGIGVDTDRGTFTVDLAALDERINKIESCIHEVMDENPDFDDETTEKGQCWGEGKFYRDVWPFERLRRHCLKIKLVPPVYSECSDWQFIRATVDPDPELCREKGVEPTPTCPCLWRTAIQDENTIISPPPETRSDVDPVSVPAPYLWEIGRMMTSCNYVWYTPFAKCLGY